MQMQHKDTSTALHPKAFDYLEKGRSSGLPHLNNLPVFKTVVFVFRFFTQVKNDFTATGIAPDLNGIPF